MAKTVRIEEISGCEGNCIVINEYRIAGPKPWGGGHVIKKWDARVDHILKALGVDVAEVVRCKDCTHYDNDKCICNFHSEEPKIYATFSVDMTPDDFCSYGERKDNEQT